MVLALVRAQFLWHCPYLERVQWVLDGAPRGPVGPPGPLELAARGAAREDLADARPVYKRGCTVILHHHLMHLWGFSIKREWGRHNHIRPSSKPAARSRWARCHGAASGPTPAGPPRPAGPAEAGKVLGWPKLCKLAHAFLWEYSYKRLKLAQLLGQLGVFLTWACGSSPAASAMAASSLCGPGCQ
jgi:hypothetical protein